MNFNEDFSASIPRWLLVYFIKSFLDKDSAHKVNKYQKMGYDIGRFTEPQKRKYRDVDVDTAQTIHKTLVDSNIDLSKATFTEISVPDDPNDIIFSKKDIFDKEANLQNKIFFYHLMWEDSNSGLPHEQVWSRGINDNELLEDTTNKKLGSLPNSKNIFQSLVEDICYLDLADSSNYLDPSELKSRKAYRISTDLNTILKLSDEQQVKNAIMQLKLKPNTTGRTENGSVYYTDSSGYVSDLVTTLKTDVYNSVAKSRYIYRYLPDSIKHSKKVCLEISNILNLIEEELSLGAELLAKNLDPAYLSKLRSAVVNLNDIKKSCDMTLLILYRLKNFEKLEAIDCMDWFLGRFRDSRDSLYITDNRSDYYDGTYSFYLTVAELFLSQPEYLNKYIYKINALQKQLKNLQKHYLSGLTFRYA